MVNMLTIKEAATATNMSQYAIRKGVTAGIYPAIRVCGNPKGKILINIDKLVDTLDTIANENLSTANEIINFSMKPIRRIAE